MALDDRAKIFVPFDPLDGFREALRDKEMELEGELRRAVPGELAAEQSDMPRYAQEGSLSTAADASEGVGVGDALAVEEALASNGAKDGLLIAWEYVGDTQLCERVFAAPRHNSVTTSGTKTPLSQSADE